MTTIHFFNPDTDYALADFSPKYSTPPKVVDVRRRLALSPLNYASPGDIIILADDPALISDPALREHAADAKGCILCFPNDIHALSRKVATTPDNYSIAPWGWNPCVREFFSQAGFPTSLLPSDADLALIRSLSHRRTTIAFNTVLNARLAKAGISPRHSSPLPREFDAVDEALLHLAENPDSFLKAPWSSSGRGVMRVDASSSSPKTSEWLSGIIRRQGSVIIESAADKAIDFASEWDIADGNPSFLGLSFFETSLRGKYIRNYHLPQEDIWEKIRVIAPDFSSDFIEAQRYALSKVAVGYTGPAGIDMLAEHNGNIRACIEINFRHTMGHASLKVCRKEPLPSK